MCVEIALRRYGDGALNFQPYDFRVAVAEQTRAKRSALPPRRRPPRPPQFAVDLLEETLFRLKWAVKGLDRRRRRAKGASQDARPSTGYGAPLTAHFNRNFGAQEIDGELRRPSGSALRLAAVTVPAHRSRPQDRSTAKSGEESG
jgi:hypothetical protein